MYDEAGSPLPIPRTAGVYCDATMFSVGCKLDSVDKQETLLDCPQLPELSPSLISKGHSWNQPPLGWVCPPEQYYELAGVLPDLAACHCGCGVIDPDCGYELTDCDDQSWNPKYTQLFCGGDEVMRDSLFCRLESATCQPLPPGLVPNAPDPDWRCIPDVYNELSDPGTSLNDCDCNCGKMRLVLLYLTAPEVLLLIPSRCVYICCVLYCG